MAGAGPSNTPKLKRSILHENFAAHVNDEGIKVYLHVRFTRAASQRGVASRSLARVAA
jgi:hypothetical protein